MQASPRRVDKVIDMIDNLKKDLMQQKKEATCVSDERNPVL